MKKTIVWQVGVLRDCRFRWMPETPAFATEQDAHAWIGAHLGRLNPELGREGVICRATRVRHAGFQPTEL